MANKDQRSTKEKKKPKSDKEKSKPVSAYKASLSGGGAPTVNPINKKF